MSQEYYLIKEAATKIGVESHVLRYWEEELKMDIHRNAMGHRYYTEKDIKILSKVKDLKEHGYQLKAVRDYLEKRKDQMENSNQKEDLNASESKTELVAVRPAPMVSNEEKMQQFQNIMNKVLAEAIRENNELIGKSAGEHAADAMASKLSVMTKEQEARAEERFRKLDETLREMQKARAEAAAANVRVDKRKRRK